MRTTFFAAVTLGVGLALAASSAAAQPASSSHEATAAAAYEAGDLETALREFEAAFIETKRPDLLYVIARLHTERNDCEKAIDYFKRYLATRPGDTQSAAAETEVAKCQKILDAQIPPPIEPPTGGGGGGGGSSTGDTTLTTGGSSSSSSLPTPDTTHVSTTSDGPRPFTSDKLGMGLLVGGVLAEGAAVVLYVQARNAQCGDPVCTDMTYEEYLDAEDKARSLQLTSIIVAGAGAVFLGGGVYRFVTRDKGRREPSVTLVPTRGGAALSFAGRF